MAHIGSKIKVSNVSFQDQCSPHKHCPPHMEEAIYSKLYSICSLSYFCMGLIPS